MTALGRQVGLILRNDLRLFWRGLSGGKLRWLGSNGIVITIFLVAHLVTIPLFYFLHRAPPLAYESLGWGFFAFAMLGAAANQVVAIVFERADFDFLPVLARVAAGHPLGAARGHRGHLLPLGRTFPHADHRRDGDRPLAPVPGGLRGLGAARPPGRLGGLLGHARPGPLAGRPAGPHHRPGRRRPARSQRLRRDAAPERRAHGGAGRLLGESGQDLLRPRFFPDRPRRARGNLRAGHPGRRGRGLFRPHRPAARPPPGHRRPGRRRIPESAGPAGRPASLDERPAARGLPQGPPG